MTKQLRQTAAASVGSEGGVLVIQEYPGRRRFIALLDSPQLDDSPLNPRQLPKAYSRAPNVTCHRKP